VLTIPHRALALRDFALAPLERIAPRWRIAPGTLTVRHVRARLRRRAG
jgi:7,8-dihydro-6-hydroxymethylpterin-pyrophosphokinase